MAGVNLSGTPGVTTSVTPLGGIIANINKGIICVQGITKRGKPGVNYLIGSEQEFRRKLGDIHASDDFATMCIMALQRGVKLRIARAFNYTNVTDLSTVTGVKASGSLPNTAVTGVQSSANFTLATWTGTGSNIKLDVPNLVTGTGTTTIANYNGIAAQTPTAAVTAIAAAINAGTATHQYTATGVGAVLTIRKPLALGAGGNVGMVDVTITLGTISTASLKFTGGVTAYAALTSTWTAEAVGDGYNETKITITPSTNGLADYVDIKIELPDSDLAQEIKGVKRVQTANYIASLNNQMEGVVVSNLVSNTLPIGTITLTNGTQDTSLITDADFKGSVISKSGWYAFDNVTDSMRIWNIARPTHTANRDLVSYCEQRKDMRCRVYIPKGLTVQGVDDFRNGNGAYSHSPLNTWYGSMWFAEVNINNPNNLNDTQYAVLAGALQAANRTKADTEKGEWYSDSGNDYGKIFGVNDMRLNLGSPGNKLLYDNIYEGGVNAIINDDALKVVSWGNRTMLLDRTSLLSKENIADLVVYISREISRIAKLMNFKPNDIAMFNLFYRKVRPFIVNELVAGRAIEGDNTSQRGEGKWWHWLGDQNARNLNELKFNTKQDIDAGKYRVRFAFKPIAANEYVGLDLAPTDSVTILNVAQLLEI